MIHHQIIEEDDHMNSALIIGLVLMVFIFILLGIPVYISLGLSGFFSLLLLSITKNTPLALGVMCSSVYTGVSANTLLAIPFYILAGIIMNEGGITEKLINLALLVIGKMPASLAQANIVASMFFGGITGSAQADTSCIGGILIPAMVNQGYTPEEAVGVTASSSTCGPIIPPSIMMVVFAVTVNCSIGSLFMAGAVPGILIGLGLMVVVAIRDRKYHFPRRIESFTKEEKIKILREGLIPLGMPVIIVGGILTGVCTPTEAGAVAVVYSLIMSIFVTKTVKVKDLWGMLLEAGAQSGAILLIISCAKILAYSLSALQMGTIVANLFLSLTTNKYVFLLMVNILLLIMGMFMDGAAALIILAPIFQPIAASLGISTIHLGIIMVLNLVIGAGTPPMGACLFIASKISGISVERCAKGIAPYLVGELTVLLLVTYIPMLATFLPTILGYAV